jgi:uncharacterized membrane protein
MKKRIRVDWEKEIQKTERIRMKGIYTSIFGFALAAVFLFGASRINDDASMFSPVIIIGCLLAATLILVFTLKRRAENLKKIREEENYKSE